MPRSRPRAQFLLRALLGLSALGWGACAGTPLPEPPDELPRPDLGSFARDSIGVVSAPEISSLMLKTGPGAVQPNTQVWVINLDTSDPPVQVAADALGAFMTPSFPASLDERLRVLSRTETQHSAPLDLHVVMPDAVGVPLDFAPLGESALACLRITPSPTLSLRGSQGTLRLENGCGSALDLTRVALRFADQGFTLSGAPAALAAGARATLTIADSQGPAARERLEIVLIDARAADGRAGRFAIDVFSALAAPR